MPDLRLTVDSSGTSEVVLTEEDRKRIVRWIVNDERLLGLLVREVSLRLHPETA